MIQFTSGTLRPWRPGHDAQPDGGLHRLHNRHFLSLLLGLLFFDAEVLLRLLEDAGDGAALRTPGLLANGRAAGRRGPCGWQPRPSSRPKRAGQAHFKLRRIWGGKAARCMSLEQKWLQPYRGYGAFLSELAFDRSLHAMCQGTSTHTLQSFECVSGMPLHDMSRAYVSHQPCK